MKNIFNYLGIVFLCFLIPIAFIAINNAQIESYEDTFPGVTTDGSSTASVTLTNTPNPNRAASITEIISDLGSDAPLLQTLNTTSRAVTVTGLNTTATRTLTVTYQILPDIFATLPYAALLMEIFLYLLILGLVVLLIVVIVDAVEGRNR